VSIREKLTCFVAEDIRPWSHLARRRAPPSFSSSSSRLRPIVRDSGGYVGQAGRLRRAGLRRAQSSNFGELSRATSASSVEPLSSNRTRCRWLRRALVYSAPASHFQGLLLLNAGPSGPPIPVSPYRLILYCKARRLMPNFCAACARFDVTLIRVCRINSAST
jgi:hypothetical protein